MPAGTCDPASRGDAYNSAALSIDNGAVTVEYRFGWDGVSTRETGCVGPLVAGPVGDRWAMRVTNTTTTTYYAHFLGRRGRPRVVTLDPETTRTWLPAALRVAGFEDSSDAQGMLITRSPETPSEMARRAT